LFLLSSFISGVTIRAFTFPGFSQWGFTVPSIHLNLLFAYIITSIVLSLVHSALVWLLRS
jgi:hypothetical protein